MTDHELFHYSDGEVELLFRRYDDGTVTASSRVVGGHRWSAESELERVGLNEVCS